IWIFIVLYGGIKVLRNFKKLVNLEIMTYAIALLAGLGTAYISGHTLDQFVTTMFMSMLAAILLNRVNENEKA
ncbi:MAG: O-antigen ligase family protein, partial [Erysipelotrichaceae bacterium]